MKTLLTFLMIVATLVPAYAHAEYVMRVSDKPSNHITMVKYFSTFRDCREARSALLALADRWVTCSPEDSI